MNIINQIKVIVLSSLFTLIAFSSLHVYASIETYQFENPQQEEDYHILIDELRCMVCQNQNLADSNAELAQDLRKQIHTMVVDQEMNRTQVADYMVERYGDFVLYKPPIKSYTLMLWLGPLLFLLIGAWFAIKVIRQAGTVSDNEK